MTTDQRPNLGQILYRLRTEMDWSREALAHRSRVSAPTIARLENDMIDRRTGKANSPTPGTLRKLANALGLKDAKRSEEIRRQLFDAAGYGESNPEEERASEVEELRRRVAALETRVQAEPPEIEQFRRLLASYPPDQRQAVLKLIQDTLEQQPAVPPPSSPARDA